MVSDSPGQQRIRDIIHRKIVRLVATHPVGRELCLIGGTRLRLLNNSVRLSNDVDFHWEGDLTKKQVELVGLLQQRLLPEVRKDLQLDGWIARASGPAAESHAVKTIDLCFYSTGPNDASPIRLNFPIDIARIARVDPPKVYPTEGAVVLTVSDQDLVESKVVALLSRSFYGPRDVLDIYLFSHFFGEDSPERLSMKLRDHAAPQAIARWLADTERHHQSYCKELDHEIAQTVEEEAAQRLGAAGGAAAIFAQVLARVRALVPQPRRLPDPPSGRSRHRGPQR